MITVIIPTINNRSDFTVLYQQLQQQSIDKFIIYIADNSKTGYVQEVVNRYQWNIETIIERNVPLHVAWNNGINLYQNNVLILNDDILVPYDLVERFVRGFNDGKLCICPDSPGFPPTRRVRESYRWICETTNQTYYDTKEIFDPYLPIMKGWCFGLSRQLINEIGLFDLQFKLWYADTDIDRRIIKKYPITFIKELFVHHYGSSSSVKLELTEFGILNYTDQVTFEKKYNLPHVDKGWDHYVIL